MIFEWTFGYHILFHLFTICYKTRGKIYWYPPESFSCSLYWSPRYRSCSSFSFYMFRHPSDLVTCVWPGNDGCRHTERVRRISLHRWRRKSHSWAMYPLVTLFDEPESCRYDCVIDDIWATPKYIVWYEVTTILSWSKELKHTLTLWCYINRLVLITSQSVSNKLGQFNMIVLLTSYSQCCLVSSFYLTKHPWSGKHDHHTTRELVLKGKTRNCILPFILHVHMSFPLNRIFKNHNSYNIEYKFLIINVEINNTNIIASRAYLQDVHTLAPPPANP